MLEKVPYSENSHALNAFFNPFSFFFQFKVTSLLMYRFFYNILNSLHFFFGIQFLVLTYFNLKKKIKKRSLLSWLISVHIVH